MSVKPYEIIKVNFIRELSSRIAPKIFYWVKFTIIKVKSLSKAVRNKKYFIEDMIYQFQIPLRYSAANTYKICNLERKRNNSCRKKDNHGKRV